MKTPVLLLCRRADASGPRIVVGDFLGQKMMLHTEHNYQEYVTLQTGHLTFSLSSCAFID